MTFPGLLGPSVGCDILIYLVSKERIKVLGCIRKIIFLGWLDFQGKGWGSSELIKISFYICLSYTLSISQKIFFSSTTKNYTKITEINLSAFAYRLFHEDFSSIVRAKLSNDD